MFKILARIMFSLTLFSLFTNSFAAVAEANIIGNTQLKTMMIQINAQVVDAKYLENFFKEHSSEKESEFQKLKIQYPQINKLVLPKVLIEDSFVYFFMGKEKVKMTFLDDGSFEVFYNDKSVKLSSQLSLEANLDLMTKVFGSASKTSFLSFFVEDAYAMIELVELFTVILLGMAAIGILKSILSPSEAAKAKRNVIEMARAVCTYTSSKYRNNRFDFEEARSKIPKFFEEQCQGKNSHNIQQTICVELQNAMTCLQNFKPDAESDSQRGKGKTNLMLPSEVEKNKNLPK